MTKARKTPRTQPKDDRAVDALRIRLEQLEEAERQRENQKELAKKQELVKASQRLRSEAEPVPTPPPHETDLHETDPVADPVHDGLSSEEEEEEPPVQNRPLHSRMFSVAHLFPPYFR